MAMINCPECGKEISDKAKACIHCGCPINEEKQIAETNTPKTITIVEDNKKSSQKKLLNSVILSLIGAIITTFLTIYLISNTDSITLFGKDIEGDTLKWSLTILFILPFAFTLVHYILKNKLKIVSCIISVLSCIIVTIGLVYFLATLKEFCLQPILLIPIALFIISAILSIIGTREYFNNAKQK